MPGRNKSKKFLKQKQGNQKKRTKFQIKSEEEIAKSNPESARSEVESITDSNNINSFEINLNNNNDDDATVINKITSNVNINETMDEYLENLREKDTKMKLATLHRINRLFRENLECDDYLRERSCDKLYELLLLLRDCLYHENNKVQCLALKTISLLMISLSDNHNIVEKQVYLIILKLINKPQSIPVQIESIKTLSSIVWTLNDSQKKGELITILSNIWMDQVSLQDSTLQYSQPVEYTEEFLQALENSDNVDNINQLVDDEDNKSNNLDISNKIDNVLKVSEDQKNELLITSIENWSWLISSINNNESIGDLLNDYNKELLDILYNNEDVSVRCAAGEALILLLSNYQTSMNNNNNNDSNDNFNDNIDMDEIENIFYDLSEENDKQRKNELKQQRIKFRGYLDTLQNGELPIVNIKLRGKEYKKEGWQIWIIYNRLKDILKEGFQLHLLKNELIQKSMNINDVEIVEQLSQFDKKSKLMNYADNAKQHKQKIKGQRKQKRAFMFEHGDG